MPDFENDPTITHLLKYVGLDLRRQNRPHSSIGNLTPIEFANSVRIGEGQKEAISSS